MAVEHPERNGHLGARFWRTVHEEGTEGQRGAVVGVAGRHGSRVAFERAHLGERGSLTGKGGIKGGACCGRACCSRLCLLLRGLGGGARCLRCQSGDFLR